MPRAHVVIGANFGDEGKGVVTDFLSSRTTGPKVVCRFNGGAQAGHTVVTPEGKRHVFSHFGAGTFAGAETYLAKHFVCNPLVFWKERRELEAAGGVPVVAADPRCFVTTPYDMVINQMVEEARAHKRHGSVGLGFGETIERNQYPSFQLWKADLKDRDKLTEKLRLIRDTWAATRCAQLGVRPPAKDDHRMSDDILEKTVAACGAFDSAVSTAGAEFLEKKAIIFEGAQGLCLDMDGPNFPHVTRSNTGLTNVIPIAKGLGLELDVVHVTRPYLTKHGAGPFPYECDLGYPVVDETNTEHPWQGTIRFGKLNVAELKARIVADLALMPSARGTVALTCVDQAPESQTTALKRELGVVIESRGPRRDHVRSV